MFSVLIIVDKLHLSHSRASQAQDGDPTMELWSTDLARHRLGTNLNSGDVAFAKQGFINLLAASTVTQVVSELTCVFQPLQL
jgi:hypothetical protein